MLKPLYIKSSYYISTLTLLVGYYLINFIIIYKKMCATQQDNILIILYDAKPNNVC